MKRSTAAVLLTILLSACATPKPAPPEETPEDVQEIAPETLLLDEVLRNITICSPDSLTAALEALQASEAGASEYGQELRYLAVTLAEILYPETAAGMPAVPLPPSGMYPGLFETIRTGALPVVPQEDVSFLTLMIPPMACLYTSNSAVLDQCRDALLQAESLATRSVLPPYLLGVISEKRQLWEEAGDYYSRALETDDSCYPADIGWARAALQTGQVEEALDRLERNAEKFPGNITIMYLRAYGNFLRGTYSQALNLITDALRTKPENAGYLLLRARILEAQGNYPQARRILSIVEEKVPGNEEIAYLRAKILYGLKEYESAAAALEEALNAYPRSRRLAELYGEVLIAAGRTDEAREYLTAKLEDDPENLRSLELLAVDARDSGEWEQAAEYIERLLALETEDRYIMLAADIYRSLGDWEKTRIHAAELYESGYGGGETVLLYLESLIRTGRNGEAERIARSALESESESEIRSDLYYNLSRALSDRDTRLDALRSALLENLHNLNALVELADIYAEIGEYRKAYRYINQAYTLSPEDPRIRAELRRIEELAK